MFGFQLCITTHEMDQYDITLLLADEPRIRQSIRNPRQDTNDEATRARHSEEGPSFYFSPASRLQLRTSSAQNTYPRISFQDLQMICTSKCADDRMAVKYRRARSLPTPGTWYTTSLREGILTFDAFKKLLVEDLIDFPTITTDEINDRSKGDAFSKGIVLLQLTWFVVQMITRTEQGLAVTEPEVTTAALAGLNSVMYVFWWSKPRDVRCPVVIQTKGAKKLLATKFEENTQGDKWTVPDTSSRFDFRNYLWVPLATSIRRVSSTAVKRCVSFTASIRKASHALHARPNDSHESCPNRSRMKVSSPFIFYVGGRLLM